MQNLTQADGGSVSEIRLEPKKMNLTDWIGALGVSLILLAYFLNVMKIVSTDRLVFILLNLVGASLACLASVLINYSPFIVLEGAWTIVSLIALRKFLGNRRVENGNR